ncbi:MAG: holo-ACP synthase [Acidimicrobiales bacterium]|jgi:holo-[acyl-carrier protein] synthase|nr:holo-ACP synthase [Acidimicrobiales bacterium]
MLGIGTDLVDIDRFRAVLARTPGIADRMFRPEERAYAEKVADPAARLAARFAAKEATLKSLGLGLGGMNLADIEVVKHDDGRPELRLHDTAAAAAEAAGATRFLLTISHTDSLAQATVVALAS